MLCLLIDVDVPQSSSLLFFDKDCFQYTNTVQSTSTHSLISSSFDASGLEDWISLGEDLSSSADHVVKNRGELDSIPLDVQNLCVGRLATSGITDYSFNAFQSLKSLVIGSGVFWEEARFELSSLPSLFVAIGNCSFFNAATVSLTGVVD